MKIKPLMITTLLTIVFFWMPLIALAGWTDHMCAVAGQIPPWAQTKRDWRATPSDVPVTGSMITDVEIWPTDEAKMAELFALSDNEYLMDIAVKRVCDFTADDNVYIQLGNELTRPRTKASFEAVTGLNFNDHWVEYYAHKLRLVKIAYSVLDPSKKLILGSIVTGTAEGRAYINELLAYTYPDGNKLIDWIDIVSVHYTSPPRFITDAYDIPVWTTEEIGFRVAQQNRGYTDALRELASHLIYWQETGQTDARLCFYAANVGTPSADDAMTEVLNTFGDVPLTAVQNGSGYIISDGLGNQMVIQ